MIHKYWCKRCGARIELGDAGYCVGLECQRVARCAVKPPGELLVSKESLIGTLAGRLASGCPSAQHAEYAALFYKVKAYPYDQPSAAFYKELARIDNQPLRGVVPPAANEDPWVYECGICGAHGRYDGWGIWAEPRRSQNYACLCPECAECLDDVSKVVAGYTMGKHALAAYKRKIVPRCGGKHLDRIAKHQGVKPRLVFSDTVKEGDQAVQTRILEAG